jgi:hypothetical protein
MQRNLEARLQKLEARIEEPSPLDDLTTEQIRAMCFSLRAQLDEEVTDELLWDNATSREGYKAALASVSEEMWERVLTWCETTGADDHAGH